MISYFYYTNIFFQMRLTSQLLISFYSWFNNLYPLFTTVKIGNLKKKEKEKILIVACQRVVMEETISEHWGLYIIYAWSSLLPLIVLKRPPFYYTRDKTPGETEIVRDFCTDQCQTGSRHLQHLFCCWNTGIMRHLSRCVNGSRENCQWLLGTPLSFEKYRVLQFLHTK